jgi:hypothetical protein
MKEEEEEWVEMKIEGAPKAARPLPHQSNKKKWRPRPSPQPPPLSPEERSHLKKRRNRKGARKLLRQQEPQRWQLRLHCRLSLHLPATGM